VISPVEIHFRFNVIEMTELELLDQKSWEEFLNAPIAVLMLSKSDCLAVRIGLKN